MKKEYPILLFLFLLPMLSIGQLEWGGYGVSLNSFTRAFYEDTTENALYVVGGFGLLNGEVTPGVIRYKDGEWESISDTLSAVGWVYAVTKFQDTLYIGGTQIGELKKWNGQSWELVGGTTINEGSINMLKVIEDELWVVGVFDSIAGLEVNSLARWDGTVWKTGYDIPKLASSMTNPNRFQHIAEYKNQIYIGGNINHVDSLSEIVRWNGQNWMSVGGGIRDHGFAWVNKMVEFQGDLYVVGSFLESAGNADNNIMRWDGSEWHRAGGGTDGNIWDATVYNGKLWITGQFSHAGGVPAVGLAAWDGEEWCGTGSDFGEHSPYPGPIGSFRDTLIIGGLFETINGDSLSHLAWWAGAGDFDTCGVLWPVRVEELNDPSFVEGYPNPTQNEYIINLGQARGEATVRIYSLMGKLVEEQQQKLTDGQLSLHLVNLTSGAYLIQIATEEEIYTAKVLKE